MSDSTSCGVDRFSPPIARPSRLASRSGWRARMVDVALVLLVGAAPFGLATPAFALPSAMIAPLAGDDPDEQTKAVQAIADSGDPLMPRILSALSEGRLYFEDDKAVFVEDDKPLKVEDGTPGPAPKGDAISANNRLRSDVESALSGMKLLDKDPKVRLAAAKELSPQLDTPMSKQNSNASLNGRRSASLHNSDCGKKCRR